MFDLPANVEEERRTDPGSRKIFDAIKGLRGHLKAQDVDLEELKSKLPQFVTYQWLIGIAGAFALAVIGIAWKLQDSALARVEENRIQREAAILQIRQEQAASNLRIESKVDGIYKFLIEGRPKAEVKAEVKAEEKAAEPALVPLVPVPPVRRR